MASLAQLRDRLPTLYRPDATDTSLLTGYLQALAAVLDRLGREADEVLQAHWLAYADRALYSPYVLRSRQLQKQPFPKPTDGLDSPYIHDLGYLAALLPLPPWQQPPTQRESVEAYRQRILDQVELYRQGFGTIAAFQRMIAAQLPRDLTAPPEHRQPPFWIEEFAPRTAQTLAVQMPGAPTDLVGPLMRWSVTNGGLAAAAPTLYLQGVAPQTDLIDATQNPVIELYQSEQGVCRLGIAYQETIGPNQTLRLTPAYRSWLGRSGSIQQSAALADPTAPGPWSNAAGAPSGAIAFHQTQANTLWVATDTDTGGALWRYNGQTWTVTLSGLPKIHCLAEREHSLLIGTATGLQVLPLYPSDDTFVASPVTALNGQTVFAMLASTDLWLGTANGVSRLVAAPSPQPFTAASLALSRLQGTPIYSLYQDPSGTLYCGGQLGVFQYQPGTQRWYWYSGEFRSDDKPDWQPLAATLPSSSEVFLPPVRSIVRSADSSLWLATDRGIARYVATPVDSFSYDTMLEAFPDLIPGKVLQIRADARGLIWFCSDRGLFRYDGRDLWQFQMAIDPDPWVNFGQANQLYRATAAQSRGAWRFAQTQWQRFNPLSRIWENFADPPRSAGESAVAAVTWSDDVIGALGIWDNTQLTGATPIAPNTLKMRFKPSEDRIIAGGIPAIPRLPIGTSTWRYLALEGEVVAPPTRPAWTIEGRLLPPPTDRPAPPTGRYDNSDPPPASDFDQAVFAFNPAAKVWLEWTAPEPFSILARLQIPESSPLDPVIIDRVWQGMQQVRAAGIVTQLAIADTIVRG